MSGRLEDYITELDTNVKENLSKGENQEKEEVVSEQTTETESSLNTEENTEQPQIDGEESNVVSLNGEGEQEASQTQTTSGLEVVNEAEDLDESKVLSFLSKKFNRELTSFDDLTKSEQRSLDPEVESFVKWTEETGYNDPTLWQKTQQTDFESLDDKTIIIEDYMLNKGFTKEQAELYYDNYYGEEAINEDEMIDSEIDKVKRSNKIKEIERQVAARESRERFSKLKQHFSQPRDGYDKDARGNQNQQVITEEAKMFWQENAKKASQELGDFVVPIGDNKGYKFSLGDYAKQKEASFSDIETFFGEFVDKKSGSWNVGKLIKATAFADNMELMAKSIYKQGLSDGAKGVVTSGKNLKFDSTEKSTPDAQQRSQLEDKVSRDVKTLMGNIGGGGLKF